MSRSWYLLAAHTLTTKQSHYCYHFYFSVPILKTNFYTLLAERDLVLLVAGSRSSVNLALFGPQSAHARVLPVLALGLCRSCTLRSIHPKQGRTL